MEAMSGWVYFPMNESLSQEDVAIRKFCPARINQELQGGGESCEDISMLNEMELICSPMYDTITTPRLSNSEEEFVDSFFNIDNNDKSNSNNNTNYLEENEVFHHFHDSLEEFSMVDDVYGDINMGIQGEEEMDLTSSSFEDFEVINSETLPVSIKEVSNRHGVDQGLELVHLLLACAEAVGCRDPHLAESILTQIWTSVSPWGDSLQRVSYCFAMGLKTRLSLLRKLNANGTFTDGAINVSLINKKEKMEAFQLLHKTTPYIAFGFMAANEAISQVAQGKDSLHIISLGMEHTLQWPSLLRTLASRVEGPPKLLRITSLVGEEQISLEVQESINGLIKEASSLGIPLEFHMISEPVTLSIFTKEKLKLIEGEALFVNSIMHLHKYVKESRGSLKTILQAINKLRPILLTVVEQDANHNGPFFLGRFLESLHYYSAIFDSLEASLQRDSPQRMTIEKLLFSEEIRNIIAYEGSDRVERHERASQWRRQLGRAGFQVVGLKSMSQARMMLSVYGCDGYTLASDKGCLLLGWKGRPIMLASAWQVHN